MTDSPDASPTSSPNPVGTPADGATSDPAPTPRGSTAFSDNGSDTPGGAAGGATGGATAEPPPSSAGAADGAADGPPASRDSAGDGAPDGPPSSRDTATSVEAVTSGGSAPRPEAGSDPSATTEFPRTDWGGRSAVPTHTGSASPADPSTEQTRDFPAYRPQSYPTYPPTLSQTTELPAVGAGGPPPTTAAAYGSAASMPSPAGPAPSAGAYGRPSPEPVRARRRDGAGFAGALGLIGICAAAVGLFALPMERYAQAQNVYLGTFRDLATRKIASSSRNHHSVSLAGEHLATLWWRFAVLPALGVLAVLFLILICIPVLRRVAGVFLFLGALAVLAGFAVAVPKTNQYRATVQLGQFTRFGWHDLALGFWVGVGGIAVLALAGLIAAFQSTRR